MSTRKEDCEYRGRKKKRPFSSGHALHVTLRSELARGPYSLLGSKHRTWLKEYIPRLARKTSVRLHHFAVQGSHIHLVLRAREKHLFHSFLRALGGRIPRRILGAEKGRPKHVRFWVGRPYSRVLSWGREFWSVMRYVERNILEQLGAIPYIARSIKLDARYRERVSESLRRYRLRRESLCNGQLVFQEID